MIQNTKKSIKILTDALLYVHNEEMQNNIRIMRDKKEIWLQKLLDGKIKIRYGK